MLVTRQEYKTYAGISSTNQDATIDSLIPKVSEFVRNFCKKSFTKHIDDPKVETFHGGYDCLILKETPLSIVSVEYSEDYGKTFTEYLDWFNDSYSIYSTLYKEWPRIPNGYRVSYICGYPDGIPEDLKLAIFDLITYYLRNDSAVHSPKAPGTNSVQLEYAISNALPAHIRRVLDYYKEMA